MSQWFECKVKYDRMMENGVLKTVSEPYLVDALSFTEAEARITDKMQPFISGEFSVDTVKRVKLSDIFYNEAGDRWYKVKTNFITIDEKTAVEKRTASFPLTSARPAPTVKHAKTFRAKTLDHPWQTLKKTLRLSQISFLME